MLSDKSNKVDVAPALTADMYREAIEATVDDKSLLHMSPIVFSEKAA
eukprot:CAMPEP_0203758758 /NCGR_PEP_ID=MMETSP0098-20131031/11595_1 /ASSEMBLY_ACC=CAM_ASM_000208 /TAXON_ID=96639 /ORGANISM=" , Strain NY0313808BC1" /LENGTH=46 /DNA_ID= /DNA_START= /DNA_END= /DNA_ORIENTATION=